MLSYTLRYVVIFTVGLSLINCARTTPVQRDILEVTANPQVHKNERVEVVGKVINYEPARGDAYRTLSFTMGDGSHEKIAVFIAGYNADAIAKASTLIGEAFEAGKPITAIGTVKIDSKAEQTVPELRLESVEYEGRKIDVSRGRKARPGLQIGGGYFGSSVGVGATITP